MRNHPARAMYDQLEDALTSITMHGSCEVASARSSGTTVTVSLPLP